MNSRTAIEGQQLYNCVEGTIEGSGFIKNTHLSCSDLGKHFKNKANKTPTEGSWEAFLTLCTFLTKI